ncbi:hypothetical protein Bca4012_007380 [Brassica carinata]|uniref:Uncharacterized protein n=1 Tax=Brassica carinata TaxID=52824 RepID=A0A8X7RNZ4_BRACI|nr:hypothetical protein Bca52824_038096 [Brassica carinata]
MAAEIDVSLSVRVFEELTSVSSLDDGLLFIKMHPSYNVIGRHPNKTPDWQRSYFFVKCDDSAFEDPPDDDYRILWNTLLGRTSSLTRTISSYTNCFLPLLFFYAADHPTSRDYPEDFLTSTRAVEGLAQKHWGNISWERVHRSIDRISRSKSILFFYFNTTL